MACRRQEQHKVGSMQAEDMEVEANVNEEGEENKIIKFTFSPPIEVVQQSDSQSGNGSVVKFRKEDKEVAKENQSKTKNNKKKKIWGRRMNRSERIAIKRAIDDLKRFRQSEINSRGGDAADKNVESVANSTEQNSTNCWKKNLDIGKFWIHVV